MTWLRSNFAYREVDIRDDDIAKIHQYCRAYIIDFLGSCVFADRSGAWAPWFKDKTRFILLAGYQQLFDEGTPFTWILWDGFEDHSPNTYPAHRVVTPLLCFFSVQWHRPDRVLRQFGMDQALPIFDIPRSEVIRNLEITQRGTRHA
ncbi:hypothetical protein LINPERHAP1_LOCUS1851 [Linum perenne]